MDFLFHVPFFCTAAVAAVTDGLFLKTLSFVSAKCWFWTNFSFRPTNKQTTLSNSRGLFFGSFERLFFFLTFFAILCYCTITRQLVVKKKLSNKARNNQRQFSKPFRIGQSCSALLVCQNQLNVNKQFLIRAQCSIFAHTHCEMAFTSSFFSVAFF
jgi:hypothetical protein